VIPSNSNKPQYLEKAIALKRKKFAERFAAKAHKTRIPRFFLKRKSVNCSFISCFHNHCYCYPQWQYPEHCPQLNKWKTKANFTLPPTRVPAIEKDATNLKYPGTEINARTPLFEPRSDL